MSVFDNKPSMTDQKAIALNRGSVMGKQRRVLWYIQECWGEGCKMKDICPYVAKRAGGRCTFMDKFMKNIYDSLTDPIDGIGDRLDQIQLDRVGMHLMPLYQQHIMFYIGTCTLRGVDYVDEKGVRRVYPHFSEDRAILSAIAREMKEIGIPDLWRKKFKDKSVPGVTAQEAEDIMMKGRPGAYEALFKE